MENREASGECMVKREVAEPRPLEVKIEHMKQEIDSDEDLEPTAEVILKEECISDEELEQPAQVTIEEYKEEVQEGYYANILPAVSTAQTSVSLSRPQTSLQLQWKEQGQHELSSQIAGNEQQWVDDKGVLTIAAPNVGTQWIATDAQTFSEREGTLMKDTPNVQYVLMTSADQFYLVESGDNNAAICASDGSIKNLVAADKNIQMISIVPNQNITSSGVVVGNIATEPEVVEVPVESSGTMIPTGSSHKRSSDTVPVLTTIAEEDLKDTDSLRKKKKVEKQSTILSDEEGSSMKKGCDLSSCPLRCTAVFDEDERGEIYRAFQSLTVEDQKKFVMQCCTRKIYLRDVKGYDGTTKTTSHFRHDFQLRSAKGVPVQVCKLFFGSTLGFSEFYFSCYLNDLYKTPKGVQTNSGPSQCTCAGMPSTKHKGKSATGKWAASCKVHSDVYSHVHRDLFHRHIESFLRTLCLQQGDHMRTIRYLPKEVSIQMMHEDFVAKHPEISCSYELYKNFVVLFTS